MKWLNEPREWKAEGGNLTLVTEAETDFWQKTFYGFRHDNGHFYYREVEGDFTAEVIFGAEYEALYDQAGLMLRTGSNTWIKTGVEFAHGRATLSAVVTNGVSDWSIGPQIKPVDRIHLRLTYKSNAVCVQWLDSGKFQTLRLCALSASEELMIGPMACSPTRAGLKACFEDFRIGPAVDFANEV
jgi:regulation of enolase protein 1 (concanavalin A-like superfamily)